MFGRPVLCQGKGRTAALEAQECIQCGKVSRTLCHDGKTIARILGEFLPPCWLSRCGNPAICLPGTVVYGISMVRPSAFLNSGGRSCHHVEHVLCIFVLSRQRPAAPLYFPLYTFCGTRRTLQFRSVRYVVCDVLIQSNPSGMAAGLAISSSCHVEALHGARN